MKDASEEIQREMAKVRETLTMADKAIEISRKEQERVSASLPAEAEADLADPAAPSAEAP